MRMFAVAAFALVFAATAHAQAPAKAPPSEHKASLAELAAKGDGEAQYRLAQSAHGGRNDALVWYMLSGSNGYAPGAVQAARLFEQRGDLVNAGRWWYRAGELGDANARNRFLSLFVSGRISSIGGTQGATWLAERAIAGDGTAKLALGDLYERGRGVPVDFPMAEQWYLSAALDGDLEAMYRLGRLQIGRPAVWRVPSKETNKEGVWSGPVAYDFRFGARNPNSDSEEPRQEIDHGRSLVAEKLDVQPKDVEFWRPGMVDGERWLKAAARRGHVEAQVTLGMSYITGIDLPLDMLDGANWLMCAAWQGNTQALMRLAELSAGGQRPRGSDLVRAWVSYDQAATLGAKGADEARDRLAKTMSARQLARARQMAQEIRDLRGM